MNTFKRSIIILLCMLSADVRGESNRDSVNHKTIHTKYIVKSSVKTPLFFSHPHYFDCVFTDRYSLNQRLKQYPFNKASKILAVSFNTPRNEELLADSSGNRAPALKKPFAYDGLKINNGDLFYSSLIEVKELDLKQKNLLTKIIYNTDLKVKNKGVIPELNCFNPRNALVFFDADGKVFDYLEICFECKRYYCPSKKLTVGNYCNQKYDLLKKFFLDLDIKTGTIYKN